MKPLDWDTGGEWRCSQHLQLKHPHGDCPGPGISLPEAIEEMQRRGY